MPIDTGTPGSPGWWFKRLIDELNKRRPRYEGLDARYCGEANLPMYANQEVADSYRRFRSMAKLNFAELIVEATRERMMPVGFRMGADDSIGGDKEAWRIWQGNQLDADSPLVHRTSLAMADAYVIVGPVDPDTGVPLITAEDPREVITAHDPAHRRKVTAALKTWCDEVEKEEYAYVYLPAGVLGLESAHVFRAARHISEGDSKGVRGFEWDAEPKALPTTRVPVVRFANKPKLGYRDCSKGEFETHTAALDRIDYTVLQRLQIITLQAFKQRAVKGVPLTIPSGPQQGQQIDYADIFKMDPAALWIMPPGADIWESGQVDLSPVQSAVKDDVTYLAAVTRTPMHYLTPDAANGSAEGASLAREGLVFKVLDRMAQAGESWEQVMSLAFESAGDVERARRPDMEVMWAPPDRFTLAEKYDAAIKAIAAGVPWRTVMLDVLGFSPQQVSRMEAERMQESFTVAGRNAIPFEALPGGPAEPPPEQAVTGIAPATQPPKAPPPGHP